MIADIAQLFLVVGTLLMLGWAVVLSRLWRTLRAFDRLPTTGAIDSTEEPSKNASAAANVNPQHLRVSAVVAARNEAGGIEASIRSLLAQKDVAIDVVVVDDGSEDQTRAILDRIAQEDPRLLVLSSKNLPPGWVAKSYALELGQGRAQGDWLLFTDADVVHEPGAVASAVGVMIDENLDHLAVQPRLEAGSLIEALVLPLFVLLYHIRFLDLRSAKPDSLVGTGIGAFNLVRADAYRLRGTHARIRGAMLDDRALGHMMREEGGRGSVRLAAGLVRMRPYHSLHDLYAGIRKTVLATFAHSALLTFVMAIVLVAAAVLPALVVVAGIPLWWKGEDPWIVVPALLAALLPSIALLRARPIVRFEPMAALLFPLGALVISFSAMHAAAVFAVRGTVEWRGRLYTQKDLRGSI